MKTTSYYYNLLRELTIADFKLKYYGSVLGFLWTFLKPFLMLSILYLVFTQFIQTGIEQYPTYLLLGIIIWNFFADATRDSMQSMKYKLEIIEKVNISPIILLVSSVVSSTITFLINLLAFSAFFILLGNQTTLHALFMLPLLAIYILFVLGVSAITSLLYLRFSDFSHLWDVFLQLLFWATPIVYAVEFIPNAYKTWILLNPVARIIVDSRNVVIYGFIPEAKQLIITIAIIGVVVLAGLVIFKRYARRVIEQT
jgi:ABC-2 type transport system permease protein